MLKNLFIVLLIFLLSVQLISSEEDLKAINKQGLKLQEQGFYEESIKYFDKVLAKDPKAYQVWFNKANSYYMMGEFGKAGSCYDKVIELNPKYAPACCYKGLAVFEGGNLEKANKYFNMALEIDPELKGVNPDVKSKKSLKGWSFVDIAFMLKNDKLARSLILLLSSKGVNEENRNGNTPLYYACLGCYKDIVEELISRGVNANEKDSSGYTPFYYVVDRGYKDIAEKLISKGLNEETLIDGYRGAHTEEMKYLIINRLNLKAGKVLEEEIGSVDGVNFTMVHIDGGSFMMGGHNLRKACKVNLDSFWIGKYEVTNREYRMYNPEHKYDWSEPDNPVDSVSWEDAVKYCEWLSNKTGKTYRLPTEAEWEYACRGGTCTEYYWGDEMDGSYCWYNENSGGNVHPVGQKKANKYGLYDMIGNVLEWCSDWYGDYPSGSVSNPSGPSSGSDRVLRGGYWNSRDCYCRVDYREHFPPNFGSYDDGFRLARSR